MTSEEVIRFLLSLIGGGTVVAVVNWAKEAISAKRQNEVACLQEQLKSLYAPLHYFTTQNQQLAQLSDDVMGAYKSEYEGKNWSEENLKALEEPVRKTIELANKYTAQIVENNSRIMQLLENNWNLIDADDVETFAGFRVNHIRMQTEIHGNNEMRLPFMIQRLLGQIYILDPKFGQRVAQKWKTKLGRLDHLRAAIWLRWRRRFESERKT